MAHYDESGLARTLATLTASASDEAFATEVIPYLLDVWLDDYYRSTHSVNIVETRTNQFSYLFDIENERLIAAWGISHGKHDAPRDKRRMAGHWLRRGPHYHRGHGSLTASEVPPTSTWYRSSAL